MATGIQPWLLLCRYPQNLNFSISSQFSKICLALLKYVDSQRRFSEELGAEEPSVGICSALKVNLRGGRTA